jgi:hypothetical protein
MKIDVRLGGRRPAGAIDAISMDIKLMSVKVVVKLLIDIGFIED